MVTAMKWSLYGIKLKTKPIMQLFMVLAIKLWESVWELTRELELVMDFLSVFLVRRKRKIKNCSDDDNID